MTITLTHSTLILIGIATTSTTVDDSNSTRGHGVSSTIIDHRDGSKLIAVFIYRSNEAWMHGAGSRLDATSSGFTPEYRIQLAKLYLSTENGFYVKDS